MIDRYFQLEPKSVWEVFKQICDTPHPSGHEERLAEALAGLARSRGLGVRKDAAGNLRIDRPASPGREKHAAILLQGHLDMVPQAAAGVRFDFLKDPIPLRIDGNYLMSSAGTTLGADNGLGVAAALALLLDETLECGPLAAVFTVSEEVGLNGALALEPDFLAGDYLLNLDSEEEGQLYIGCAGGARLELSWPVEAKPVPVGLAGVALEVRNLAGGHSGCNIDSRRGNAVKFLALALARCPELRVGSAAGGTLDNVIPREAAAACAVDAALLPELRERLSALRDELAAGFDAPAGFAIELSDGDLPERVWKREFQRKVVAALADCPNEVIARDESLDVVRTSSNLAAIRQQDGVLHVRTSQRSFSDAEREDLTERIRRHFAAAGASAQVDNSYPGWEPAADSRLLKVASKLYCEMFGVPPLVKVIHAGLECGILAGKQPKLEMLSFGPTLENPHSPGERLDIASVDRFYRYLRALVVRIG